MSLKLSFEAGFVLALESKFPLKISARKQVLDIPNNLK